MISWAHGTTGIARPVRAVARHRLAARAARALAEGGLRGRAHGLRGPRHARRPPVPDRPLGGLRDARRRARAARKAGQAAEPPRRDRRALAGRPRRAVGRVAGAALHARPDVRGTVAFAPVSHLGEQAALLPNLTPPGGLSGLVAMIVRGVDIAQPDLGVTAGLTDRAAALYPRTLTDCIGTLAAPGSFGALAPADVIRAGVDTGAVIAALGGSDPEDLRIRTPRAGPAGDRGHHGVQGVHRPARGGLPQARHPGHLQDLRGRRPRQRWSPSPRSARDATAYLRSRLR